MVSYHVAIHDMCQNPINMYTCLESSHEAHTQNCKPRLINGLRLNILLEDIKTLDWPHVVRKSYEKYKYQYLYGYCCSVLNPKTEIKWV